MKWEGLGSLSFSTAQLLPDEGEDGGEPSRRPPPRTDHRKDSIGPATGEVGCLYPFTAFIERCFGRPRSNSSSQGGDVPLESLSERSQDMGYQRALNKGGGYHSFEEEDDDDGPVDVSLLSHAFASVGEVLPVTMIRQIEQGRIYCSKEVRFVQRRASAEAFVVSDKELSGPLFEELAKATESSTVPLPDLPAGEEKAGIYQIWGNTIIGIRLFEDKWEVFFPSGDVKCVEKTISGYDSSTFSTNVAFVYRCAQGTLVQSITSLKKQLYPSLS